VLFLAGCKAVSGRAVEVMTYSVSEQSMTDRRFQVAIED